MSRERFIDPRIWASEQFCALSRDARILFVGMITTADDCGFCPASPHALRITVFPTDHDLDRDSVSSMLDEIVAQDLARIVGGGSYIWIPTFFRWQPLKWRSKSKILAELVEAGEFTQDLDGLGRVSRCCHIRPEPARSSLNQTGSGESCRVVSCRVEGKTFPDVSVDVGTSVGNQGVTSTAGMAHDAPEATTEPTEATEEPKVGLPKAKRKILPRGPASPPDPIKTPETRDIVQQWIDSEKFRKPEALRQIIRLRDDSDPVITLAHILEIKAIEGAKSRCAILWSRFEPGSDVIIPAEKWIESARKILNGSIGNRGGPISADSLDAIVKSIKKGRGNGRQDN